MSVGALATLFTGQSAYTGTRAGRPDNNIELELIRTRIDHQLLCQAMILYLQENIRDLFRENFNNKMFTKCIFFIDMIEYKTFPHKIMQR
jgi:hypothetical protein